MKENVDHEIGMKIKFLSLDKNILILMDAYLIQYINNLSFID